jgi:hypothetical protein
MTAILLFFILMVLLFGSAAVLSFFQGALALGVIAFLLTAAVALCFFLLACLFHGANAIGQGAKWLVNNPQVVGGKIRSLGFGLGSSWVSGCWIWYQATSAPTKEPRSALPLLRVL